MVETKRDTSLKPDSGLIRKPGNGSHIVAVTTGTVDRVHIYIGHTLIARIIPLLSVCCLSSFFATPRR